MILIIGANAAATPRLIPFLNDKKIVLVGREAPKFMNDYANSETEIQYIPTNYSDAPDILNHLPDIKKLTVVFAGIYSEPTLIINLKKKQIETELLSNLEFSAHLVSLLIPLMMQNRFGRFIFLGSKESTKGVAGGVIYSMIKNAQIGLSRTIAVEYARFGITSNVLQLGLLEDGYSTKLPINDIEKMKLRIPKKSKLDYKDISQQINVLVEASAINGAVIDIVQAIR